MSPITDLTTMKSGLKGTVLEIHGGCGLLTRLENMGIRPNIQITKVSAQLGYGPVTVRVGNTQVAMGFGMASKIRVQLDKS